MVKEKSQRPGSKGNPKRWLGYSSAQDLKKQEPARELPWPAI